MYFRVESAMIQNQIQVTKGIAHYLDRLLPGIRSIITLFQPR
jgi:hypothetical protein